tara:strand:+ start:981 stop:1181 length:201 start_codon:yes stop_codon:yes gene_type:complete
MKYRYNGTIPTLVLIEGSLKTVRKGDVVELAAPPSPQFVLEEAPKVVFSAPVTRPKKRRKLDGSSS